MMAKSQRILQGTNAVSHDRGIGASTCKSPTCTNVYLHDKKDLSRKWICVCQGAFVLAKVAFGTMHLIVCTYTFIYVSESSLCMRVIDKEERNHPTSDFLATSELSLFHLVTTNLPFYHPALTRSRVRCKSTV